MDQLSFDDLEEWRPIEGYEGIYEISSLGRAKSLARISYGRRIRERILKANLISAGYPSVGLHCDGVMERLYVHHLVAAAFLGPRPEGLEIRHLDGNPENNRLSNLAYGTHAENMADMVRHGRSHAARRSPECGKGHKFTPENTIFHGRRRRCRQCQRDQSREQRKRKRLQREAREAA